MKALRQWKVAMAVSPGGYREARMPTSGHRTMADRLQSGCDAHLFVGARPVRDQQAAKYTDALRSRTGCAPTETPPASRMRWAAPPPSTARIAPPKDAARPQPAAQGAAARCR